MTVSEPIYINFKGSFRKYRVDSIGRPESPMRCWMLNLLKKYNVSPSYLTKNNDEKSSA